MLHLIADNPNPSPADESFSMAGSFTRVEDVDRYLRAGHATVTLRSLATGTRFTFKVSVPKDDATTTALPPEQLYFVGLLSGPDNTADYTYIGVFQNSEFRLTRKSRMAETAEPIKAFRYMLHCLYHLKHLPPMLQIWHEGRCGRCGRPLTVPESIERGIGPECASKMGL